MRMPIRAFVFGDPHYSDELHAEPAEPAYSEL